MVQPEHGGLLTILREGLTGSSGQPDRPSRKIYRSTPEFRL